MFLTLYRPKLYRALRFRSIEKTGIPNPPWAFGGLLPPLGLLDSFAIGYEVVKLGLSPAISPRPQLFHPSSRRNTARFMVISRRVRSHQFIPNSQLGKRRTLRDWYGCGRNYCSRDPFATLRPPFSGPFHRFKQVSRVYV